MYADPESCVTIDTTESIDDLADATFQLDLQYHRIFSPCLLSEFYLLFYVYIYDFTLQLTECDSKCVYSGFGRLLLFSKTTL